MGLDTCGCMSVRGVTGKKEVAPTNLEVEHAEKGRDDTSPGSENKLRVFDEGRVVDFKVLLAIDFAATVGGEVGVLVREKVTDSIMDSF